MLYLNSVIDRRCNSINYYILLFVICNVLTDKKQLWTPYKTVYGSSEQDCLARLQTDKYWSVPIHNRLLACLFASTVLDVWYCNNNSYSLLPRNSEPIMDRLTTDTGHTPTQPILRRSSRVRQQQSRETGNKICGALLLKKIEMVHGQ